MHLPEKPQPLPEELDEVCRKIFYLVKKAGGRALLVGGCVRDALLNVPVLDVDIEVFGLGSKHLEKAISRDFSLDWVGRAFGVFKIRGYPIDLSLPRRESKKGVGHRGFEIEEAPYLTFEEAASRRDFTLNAISWDFLSGEIIDPFDGREDLRKGILRPTSEKFSEDPLRVLRAMQLAARFELQVDAETVDLCREISAEDLSPERIFEEWKKMILKGRKPSVGLHFLNNCGWLSSYPELEALVGCPQDPIWHPEGDVWVHTLHCLDAFAKERTGDDWEDLVVGFAVLCHDLGKPATTAPGDDGRIRSPGHEAAGKGITQRFLARMTQQKDLIEEVTSLVKTHMRPVELYKNKAGDSAIRRLARSVKRIDRLVRVAWADMQGRPPMEQSEFPAGEWLLAHARKLEVEESVPQPIILGRHLIELGQEPGPHFKGFLETCYEAQMDGVFETLEQGKAYLSKLLAQE